MVLRSEDRPRSVTAEVCSAPTDYFLPQERDLIATLS